MSRPNLACPEASAALAASTSEFQTRHMIRRPSLPAGLCTGMMAAGLAVGLIGAFGFASAPHRSASKPAVTPVMPKIKLAGRSLAQLPLRFEANQGQTSAQARFLARTRGGIVFLTSDGAVVKTEAGAVRMSFLGSQPVAPEGSNPLRGKISYLRKDSAITVQSFARVRYLHLYPGVDLVYYGHEGQLEYDLRLAAQTRPERIQMRFSGATPVLAANGDLELEAGVHLLPPVAFQTIDGTRRGVQVRYTVEPDHTVGFAVGAYDASQALVIDPVLAYSTYLGGTNFNQINAVAADAAGNAIVVGSTLSADFPKFGTPFQSALKLGGGHDAFVTEISPDGSALIYSTYLGGSQDDQATGVAVDAAGDAFVTGYTNSPDFPTTAGAYQVASKGAQGNYDAFVVELNPTGSGETYGTLLSGSFDDFATGIVLDSAGNAIVAGYTSSTDFPNSGNPQAALQGTTDGFITAVKAGGASLLFSTYLGGNSVTKINGIAIGQSGNIYVGGTTSSTTGFPVTPGALQPTLGGGFDGFVAKLNHFGLTWSYVTYLGGTAGDSVNAIAVDAAGYAFVTGYTSSVNIFPNTGSFESALSGRQNAFVAKINTDGSLLSYASYLGGSQSDTGTGIAVDATDNAYVVGFTSSNAGFPLVGAYQPAIGGVADAFLAKVAGDGNSLLYSTYLGGVANDGATGIALDASGDIFIAGNTSSPNFPTTTGAYQQASNSSNDGFVAKFVAAAQGSFVPTTLGFTSQANGVASTPSAVVFTNTGEKPLTITNIATTGPFAQTNNCPATMQPQTNCTLQVIFTPTSPASATGSLVISDNSPSGAETLPISGNGGDFTLAVSPTNATISAGTSASYQLQISPATGYTGVVALSCTGNPLPPNTTCVASPTSLTMNGTTQSSAIFTVTTTIRPSLIPPGPTIPSGPWTWLVIGVGLALFSVWIVAWQRARGRRRMGWAGVAILLGWAAVSVACGGSTTNPGTTAGNYTLTFTGTSGSVKHDITATLTVN